MRLLIIEDDRELSYVMKAGLEKAVFMSMLLKSLDREYYRAKSIGVIFQSFNLLTTATAVENIMLSMNISGSQPSHVTFERQQAGSIPSNDRSVEPDGEDFEEWFRNNQN